jgi:tetratricopeptide (TPR) repeat protein
LLRTPEQVEWLARLQAEHGNLLAALHWTVEVEDAELADRLCAALGWYWFMQGDRAESAAVVRDVLAIPGAVPSLPRAVVTAFGAMAAIADGYPDAAQRVADAVAYFELVDVSQHPLLLLLRPTLAIFTDAGHTAVRELDEVLPRLDPWGQALGVMFRAFIEENEGRHERSGHDMLVAKNAFAATGDRWGLAMTTRALAGVHSLDGDHDAAIAAYREALTYLDELGSVDDVAETVARIGLELLRSGDLAGGHAELTTALRLSRRYGQPEATIWALCGLGEHALRAGDTGQARRFLDDALTEALAGRFPSQVAAVVLTQLADVDIAEGDASTARDRLDEAIDRAVTPADMPILATAVHTMAGVALLTDGPEHAAELLGSAESLRGTRDRSDGDPLRTERRVRALLSDAAFDAAYGRGTALSREEIMTMLGHLTPSATGMQS